MSTDFSPEQHQSASKRTTWIIGGAVALCLIALLSYYFFFYTEKEEPEQDAQNQVEKPSNPEKRDRDTKNPPPEKQISTPSNEHNSLNKKQLIERHALALFKQMERDDKLKGEFNRYNESNYWEKSINDQGKEVVNLHRFNEGENAPEGFIPVTADSVIKHLFDSNGKLVDGGEEHLKGLFFTKQRVVMEDSDESFDMEGEIAHIVAIDSCSTCEDLQNLYELLLFGDIKGRNMYSVLSPNLDSGYKLLTERTKAYLYAEKAREVIDYINTSKHAAYYRRFLPKTLTIDEKEIPLEQAISENHPYAFGQIKEAFSRECLSNQAMLEEEATEQDTTNAVKGTLLHAAGRMLDEGLLRLLLTSLILYKDDQSKYYEANTTSGEDLSRVIKQNRTTSEEQNLANDLADKCSNTIYDAIQGGPSWLMTFFYSPGEQL